MENACRNETDELNSTEKIPSLNGDRLKTGVSSSISPCRKSIELIRINNDNPKAGVGKSKNISVL